MRLRRPGTQFRGAASAACGAGAALMRLPRSSVTISPDGVSRRSSPTNESARGQGALSALNRHVASEPKEVSLRERSPGGDEPGGVGFAQMTENAPPKFIGLHCGSPAGHQTPGRERSALSERRHFG